MIGKIVKIVLIILFALINFVLVQGEYEIITKPYLQNDFPIIKGIGAVYVLGLIIVVLAALTIYLLLSLIKSYKKG